MNNNIVEIFNSRIKKENDKRSSYRKYILNSHLIMFLLIVGGGVMFNYSNWLEIASKIELQLVLTSVLMLMAYILTTIKVKTFIKEADTIFLLPLENRYKEILNKLIVPTIVTKTLIATIFIASTYPIITKLNLLKTNFILFVVNILIIIIIITILKYKKVIYSQLELKDFIVIFSISLLTIVIFVYTNFLNLVCLLIILYYVISLKNVQNNINWYSASDYDTARNEKYLKFINMFVDVPINVTKVARRKYFDIFLPKLTKAKFNSNYAYKYYYLRAFLRQENTIFLLIRLMLVASVIIYSFNNAIVSFIVIIAYNYLVIIQILPFYKKINDSLWSNILPISEEIKFKNFSQIILMIMSITSFLLLIFAGILLTLALKEDKFLVWLPIAPLLGNLINMYFINNLKNKR